ncbi:MAG: pantetheine-phosphate adenylyltransferase [Propionibacteriaceae bacterium]|nr:pantetheine-phosphate adenylyltransferase [Propionibacteriaceae bacterium]
MKAVVPGSFDPFTLGHLDIVERASRLFDQVVVAVGLNSAKDYLFPLEERVELVRASCRQLAAVTVEPMPGLLVDFCLAHDVGTIVKGARLGRDFEVELGMAQMNASLTAVETVILPTRPSWSFVSSSLVRQIARGQRDISPYVPAAVVDHLQRSRHVHSD